jgi:hypothetical protein
MVKHGRVSYEGYAEPTPSQIVSGLTPNNYAIL